ncbi:tyrosine-type recombinase/integrase [soil metagenome]
MGTVRDRMIQDLAFAGYAERTQRVYLSAAEELVAFHRRSPSELTQDQVRTWVDHLLQRGLSAQRIGQHFAALRLLFGKTMGRPEVVAFLTRPRANERLPIVLSIEEVGRLLDAIATPKFHAFFTLLYATGLRISEAVQMETRDIDAARGVIHVRHGKGKSKERFVPLSARLLAKLRDYWKSERPAAPWLFASAAGRPLHGDVLRMALALAAEQAQLTKRVTPHLLRHSFATHMLEGGTDLRVLQVLLGHAKIETTARYVRVSTAMIAKAGSPLDLLPQNDEAT